MTEKVWRILFVDDDETFRKQAEETLREFEKEIVNVSDSRLEIKTFNKPQYALEELQKEPVDLLILDVKQNQTDDEPENEQAGRTAFELIKSTRFIPIIFYTGVPDLVIDLESPSIRVVEKTQGLDAVAEQVKEIFRSGIPAINRGIIKLLEETQKNYLWTFIEEYGRYHGGDLPDVSTLSYLLARRLAAFVSGNEGITQLAQHVQEWGAEVEVDQAESKVNPLRCYIMPSLALTPRTGDIYKSETDEQSGYWIVLSPTCDLVNGKIEQVLMASCQLLEDQREYQEWKAARGNAKQEEKRRKALEALLRNNREKQYGLRDAAFFLPSALNLPNLTVDFRKLVTLPSEALKPDNQTQFRRIASLDSPFAESLLSRYVQFSGRVGTPDLHLDGIVQRLQQESSGNTTGSAPQDKASGVESADPPAELQEALVQEVISEIADNLDADPGTDTSENSEG